MINSFTLLFLVLCFLKYLTQYYLASRQIRTVSRLSGEVPREFASKISLENHQKAAKYTIANQKLFLIEVFLDVIVLLSFTLLGGLNALNQYLVAQIDSPIYYQIALIFTFFFILSLIHLPISIYRTFVLEASFGFNRMTAALFLSDLVKNLLLSLLILGPLLYGLFLFLEHFYSPQWWIWCWGFFSLFNLVLLFIAPRWIMPLFNQFKPLSDESLKQRIQALAERAQFSLKEVFVMDGSKRSSHGNAFFTGFGHNRRIVFYDTLLTQLTSEEIEAVLAHELGHFKHRHIIKRLFMNFAMSFLFFAMIGYLVDKTWFYIGLGVFPNPSVPPFGLAILLSLLFLPLVIFLATPLGSFLSRKDEFEADRYAASQSNAQALISALVKLYNDNASTLTPDPLYTAFYNSHPPASLRIQHLKAVTQS